MSRAVAKKRPPAKVPDPPPQAPKPVVPPQVVHRRQKIQCDKCGSYRVERTASCYDRGLCYFRCWAGCAADNGEQYTFKLPVA